MNDENQRPKSDDYGCITAVVALIACLLWAGCNSTVEVDPPWFFSQPWLTNEQTEVLWSEHENELDEICQHHRDGLTHPYEAVHIFCFTHPGLDPRLEEAE